ncbi:serine/threonine-protein kinase [Mycobacterium sp. NPDC050041]|uniref:serine/threonine-protein kinase n=1 Tax=Mycobacterium sp. NPDC050041 TaxID=3364293 RepID=UPI003C2B96B6
MDGGQGVGGATTFGWYRLERLLGSGAMGQVFRAYDTQTQRVVAVKVLAPHMAADTDFQARFRREAHLAAQLSDPHVIPIHRFGEIDGRLFVDMRLVEGRDLDLVLRESPGGLEPFRAVAIVEQIASALEAAHRVGLVHRDVKPSNVLIGARDFAYLIDFGIARATHDSRLTATGMTFGTLAYMAPERFSSDTLDPRSDVYSLACVLFECLTGKKPYGGGNPQRVMAGHMFSPPPRTGTVKPGLPALFDGVIGRGLAKDPADRFATVSEFARAARGVLDGTVQVAPQPPPAHFGGFASAGPGHAPMSGPHPAPAGGFAPLAPQPGLPPGVRRPWWRRRAPLVAAAITAVATLTAGGVIVATQDRATSPAATQSQDPPPASYGEPIELPIRQVGTDELAVDDEGSVYATGLDGVIKLPAGSDTPTKLPLSNVMAPSGVAVDDAGAVYVASYLTPARVVRLGAGATPQIDLPFTGLESPQGVAVDPAGDVYVVDQTRRVVRLSAGSSNQVEMPFRDLRSSGHIAVDATGTVYATQVRGDVLKMGTSTSGGQEVVPFTGLVDPSGIAVDGDGAVYITDLGTGKVWKLDAGTGDQEELPFVDLVKPNAVAVDGDGNVYVSDVRDRVVKLPVR